MRHLGQTMNGCAHGGDAFIEVEVDENLPSTPKTSVTEPLAVDLKLALEGQP